MATDATTYLATTVLNEQRVVSTPLLNTSPEIHIPDRLLIEH